MNLAYYSGFKEKETLRRCMDILIQTETRIKKYDNLEDTLYISYNNSHIAETGVLEVEKAFKKAGYLDIKVKYIGGGTRWTHMFDAEKYYHAQYNKVLKEECFEPLVLTFLNQYLDWNMEEDNSNRVNESKVKNNLFTVEQARQNISEVYQCFDINDRDEKNRLSCFVMAILHAAGLANNNIIIRFLPMQQDREIVYNISTFISDGEIEQSMEKFISKLSKNEMKKVIKVVNWEVEYINEYVSAEVKTKIKNRFEIIFLK